MVAEPRLRVHVRQGTLPSQIVATTGAGGDANTALTFANDALTTLTQTIAVTAAPGATGLTTSVRTLIIQNSSQLESALSEGITATPQATSATSTQQTSAATSSAAPATKNGGSKMGTLIPAIVVPIAIVLLMTFGLFWWIMHRRTKKLAKKEPEFVMEKRKRTRQHSRDESTHSNSSTRKLVSKNSFGTGLNKESVPAVREISRPSMDVFSDHHEPSNASNGLGIGVAKSPDHTPSHSRQASAESENPSGTPARAPVAVRNFSRGPTRPSTASNEQPPSQQSLRDRSMSNPGARPMPPPGSRPDPRDQQFPRYQTSMLDRPDPRRPPPNMRGPPPPGPLRGPPRGPPPGPGNDRNSPPGRPGPGPGPVQRPLQEPMVPIDVSRNEPVRNRPIVPPPAIETQESQAAQKPSALNPPTPTGAYNGASPISQYSPIIKEHPKMDDSPLDANTERVAQTGSGNGNSPGTPQFTEENMRIARLADSSRLGFYKDTNNKALPAIATSHVEEPTVDPPNPSPRLPPPATRDAPPLNFPPPPPPPADSPTMPSSRRADSFMNDRRSMRSMVSRLSDDEYVDMEVDDAKSDVSSLDEREKWDMENEVRGGAGSRATNNNSSLGGYGGLGAPGSNLRAPLVQQPGTNSKESGSQYKQSRF